MGGPSTGDDEGREERSWSRWNRMNYSLKTKCMHVVEILENTKHTQKIPFIWPPKDKCCCKFDRFIRGVSPNACYVKGIRWSRIWGPLVWLAHWQEWARKPFPTPPGELPAKGLIVCLKEAPLSNTTKPHPPFSSSVFGIRHWLITVSGGTRNTVAKRKSNTSNVPIKTRSHPSVLVKVSINTSRRFFSTGLHHFSAGIMARDGWKNSRLRKKFLLIH